ncbi:MAG TPA: homoserine kinase [Edaphobacter sp.]|nr:homoserine kinase [Edaphobacter sp.]
MKSLRLRLPATSANLGPGFDALGLAMAFYLTVEATVADAFRIEATGRNADLCGDANNSLIFKTYTDVLVKNGKIAAPLRLILHNEIPLGMGCGSSAAALLAGALLANYFGELGWSDQQILEETCHREGHPDNVAACFLGGMTASAENASKILTATYRENINWSLLVSLPAASLATEKARALLPNSYSRADAVGNVQNTALLVSAFALNRGDLLRVAMQDRIHQPYRMEACPLLKKLLPLMGASGVLGVALSGAGPSVLTIVEVGAEAAVTAAIREAAGDPGLEIIQTTIAGGTEAIPEVE